MIPHHSTWSNISACIVLNYSSSAEKAGQVPRCLIKYVPAVSLTEYGKRTVSDASSNLNVVHTNVDDALLN